uniref:Uncharacterized protein n=1 Tax=Kwoniella pini CBS 10737 TaxID=1296096 RepID=A0A1B9HXM1_9TREE|nr:uncharacterized protein I206_05881 [Kwoniella pini CBS 10737]OCF48014.1 hypothetical protein I206_05881 [Kwoniella pini CBS 10737]
MYDRIGVGFEFDDDVRSRKRFRAPVFDRFTLPASSQRMSFDASGDDSSDNDHITPVVNRASNENNVKNKLYVRFGGTFNYHTLENILIPISGMTPREIPRMIGHRCRLEPKFNFEGQIGLSKDLKLKESENLPPDTESFVVVDGSSRTNGEQRSGADC